MSRSSGWREAGQHASEDARRREEVELINGADNTAYHAERFLQENSSNVPSSQKLELEHRIQEMRGALERRDVSTARSVLTSVEQALQRVGEAGAAAGSNLCRLLRSSSMASFARFDATGGDGRTGT